MPNNDEEREFGVSKGQTKGPRQQRKAAEPTREKRLKRMKRRTQGKATWHDVHFRLEQVAVEGKGRMKKLKWNWCRKVWTDGSEGSARDGRS